MAVLCRAPLQQLLALALGAFDLAPAKGGPGEIASLLQWYEGIYLGTHPPQVLFHVMGSSGFMVSCYLCPLAGPQAPGSDVVSESSVPEDHAGEGAGQPELCREFWAMEAGTSASSAPYMGPIKAWLHSVRGLFPAFPGPLLCLLQGLSADAASAAAADAFLKGVTEVACLHHEQLLADSTMQERGSGGRIRATQWIPVAGLTGFAIPEVRLHATILLALRPWQVARVCHTNAMHARMRSALSCKACASRRICLKLPPLGMRITVMPDVCLS